MEKIIEQFEQLEDLFRQGKNFSNIEKDLILEKLRNLYEMILKGIKIESNTFFETTSPIVIAAEANPSPTLDEISALEVDEKINEQERGQDEIETEEIMPEVEEKSNEIKDPVLPGSGIDLFSASESKTVVEQKETIVDKISMERKKETVADIFQKNKISSLKDTIGINDKFFFINELFSGELKLYNQSIERLDSASSADERKELLSELKNTFGWDDESDAWLKLQEFVQKKFTS